MPQNGAKQRGRATVVDQETPVHLGNQLKISRKLNAIACADCRKRKRKCNGERPSCSVCRTRGLSCMYDVAEGATRTEDLKQKIGSFLSRVQNLELLIDMMRYGTDDEASMILAQLRLGDTVDEILCVDMAWFEFRPRLGYTEELHEDSRQVQRARRELLNYVHPGSAYYPWKTFPVVTHQSAVAWHTSITVSALTVMTMYRNIDLDMKSAVYIDFVH
ncbi:hypothetical protein E4T52_16051 [Aureobasidium sp. EXF-3400]|nr:hypothetical protein E4T51_15274 [Aureobasidium sp. EXF-12344]KAI4768875.1 hypothetical protein E4T52_16051 [Aureobasidium sp. EXF-3400]